MRLIYLSPVAWDSFAQRPHKFVDWFHARSGAEVLWIDPYPTRLPSWRDLNRLRGTGDHVAQPPTPWLRRLRTTALPIEPLPGSGWINRWLWRDTLTQAQSFAAGDEACCVVVGKPSVMALQLLDRIPQGHTTYDAMDDFPAFFSGLSRLAAQRRERALVHRVSSLLVSSTCLQQRWQSEHRQQRLVPNALDPAVLPVSASRRSPGRRRVLGYVGTMAAWFDWQWVAALARARPQDEVRLIGPVFTPCPVELPGNVTLLPPVAHAQALQAMTDFDVALIPFKLDRLTDSVDPIKFYEYRALGLPVVSTAFGEMRTHGQETGCWVSASGSDAASVVEQALQHHDDEASRQDFIAHNSWHARFDSVADIVLSA